MTIATGSGDPTDLVKCHECGGEFKAYYIAGVGKGISIDGKRVGVFIDRVYATERTWFELLHKAT